MAQAIVGVVAGWFGGGVLATAAAQLLTSVAFSALARALAPKPKGQDLLRELQLPNALPAYRYVYGTTRAAGTPAPVRVKDKILYGCYILNSRPSAGPFTVLFDKREVVATGDPYDFAGGGAVATNDPFDGYATYWIGRGSQTSPPAQILTEAPDLFGATDGWQGRTVLWVRLDAGSSSSRSDRWPSAPPEVMVDGKWSKVWDPRAPGQDPDDPTTWTWSDNYALCALDALRQNPFAAYDDRNLWLETFEWAADVADAGLPVKAGGTIRLAANGTLAFVDGSELEDQVQPLLDAGAARWVRARGQLGIIPAVAQDVALTITDLLDGAPARFTAHAPRDSLATHATGKFVAPDRAYELTDLPAYEVPGALAADGGLAKAIQPQYDMVTDHRQGQWLQAVAARQQRRQRTMTCMVPPEALNLVGGSWVDLDLPSPWTRRSGLYEVESMQPVFTDGEAGVTLQIEVSLREISAALFAWTPSVDEQDVEAYDFDGTVAVLDPPGTIISTSGADQAQSHGGEFVPRILFEFAPSSSAAVTGYRWQWRVTGGSWVAGGTIDEDVRNASNRVFAYLANVSEDFSYEIRVRAIAPGKVSAWVTDTAIVVTTATPRYEALFEDVTYRLNRVTVTRGTVFGLTRASTGTYVDSSGVLQTAAADAVRLDHTMGTRALLVEAAATNAWTYSEDLTQSVWAKTRTTISANAIAAPDGAVTADKLVEDTSASASHFMRRSRSYVDGQQADFSLFLKAGERTRVRVSTGGTGMTTRTVQIDLSTGSVTVIAGSPAVAIYPLANGWYWLTFTIVPAVTVVGYFEVRLINGTTDTYTGDGTSGVYVWGLQDGAGSYIPTGASTASRAADVPEMRGITASLDLSVVYGDGTVASINNVSVYPGAWPSLTKTRIRRLTGTP